jgi:hypothetical protein
LGQFSGGGIVAPLFYFFSFVFGPSASDLARISPRSRSVLFANSIPLLPLILILHTLIVFFMFLAPDLSTRHYWTWAWQLTPFWIAILNTLLTQMGRLPRLKNTTSVPIRTMLLILGFISASVWMYTAVASPYSMSTIFIPEAGPQDEFIQHTRKALQADELSAFLASLLWLLYSFFDLHAAGLAGNSWLFYAASLPVVMVCVGPGASLIVGWYWREKIISGL